jgi:predicted phosphoribosyltransferase/alpha-beta hydrolase superfamily lysophospholipase
VTVLLPDLGAPPFRDRRDAGRRLAERLEYLRDADPVVIGLPRGGIPVAYEIAAALGAPLDVAIVRKLGAPFQPEYAIGAIGEEDVAFLNPDAVGILGLGDGELEHLISRERDELERRRRLYRGNDPPLPVRGRTVILVDDGIATGASAAAAARILRRRGAARVVLAVPVGPPGAGARFGDEVDDFICLEAPEDFFAVGSCYEHFGQTSDEEVEQLLRAAREPHAPVEPAATSATRGDPPHRIVGGIDLSRTREQAVQISAGGMRLPGDLRMPPSPVGLVIFAHGSGSSRLSPRNVQVATTLNGAGLATLLFDLLTEDEAADRGNVFDIDLLGERLVAATRWAQRDPSLAGLPFGYFGASTGAAAALCAAADLGGDIRAVVSRGGRPDLAEHRLAEVTAPTLLIVGGEDRVVLELNEAAAASLRCPHRLEIVAGATHLFEEPGALERVADLASRWFSEQLIGRAEVHA